jgi:hypothetical protein
MEQKMIHKLSILLAHTVPIDHNDMSLPKVVHVRIFPRVADQAKKPALKGTIVCKKLFQGK